MIINSLSHTIDRRIKLILGSIIVSISIIYILSSYLSRPVITIEGQTDIFSLFKNNDEYISYVMEKVNFDDIKFTVVSIERGDNFWQVAKTFNINIDTILGTNPYIPDLLARVNQKLLVPSSKGTLVFIRHIDELSRIEKEFNVSRDKLVVQKLPFFHRYYDINEQNGPIGVFIRGAKPITANMTDKMARLYTIREMFVSPLGGRFSSYFGTRRHPIFRNRSFHNGIDIAVRYGTPVAASRAGRVIGTGWMGGYGKTVVIQHDNGYKTLYGHLSRITVRNGAYVGKGRLIGRAGSTGFSTGPHLHFTIWRHNKLINPLKILW